MSMRCGRNEGSTPTARGGSAASGQRPARRAGCVIQRLVATCKMPTRRRVSRPAPPCRGRPRRGAVAAGQARSRAGIAAVCFPAEAPYMMSEASVASAALPAAGAPVRPTAISAEPHVRRFRLSRHHLLRHGRGVHRLPPAQRAGRRTGQRAAAAGRRRQPTAAGEQPATMSCRCRSARHLRRRRAAGRPAAR